MILIRPEVGDFESTGDIEGILRAQLPMSGFDNAKVDAAFFEGTTWKSNFICNLGYGDSSKLRPRAPRLEFNEACKIL